MKRVNQFERTDRDITNALLALMEHRRIEKIPVQDILDEALVNRSTFYQHFTDKYAILERLQEKYISEMTERIDAITRDGEWDLEKINAELCEFMSKHRRHMQQILSVRSENLNMEEQLCRMFAGYLRRSGSALTELEADMLSSVMVRFLVHFLNQEMDASELSMQMLDNWLDMSLYFFRVDQVPDAKQRLLTLIGSMHME